MCGIAGYLTGPRQMSRDELRGTVLRMADTLRLRGPDDGGAWVDVDAGIALGHRRLAIIDLSVEGHQPMHSACGRYVIVFNGEIYNYKTIRRELERESQGPSIAWRGHSDTEVALAAISRWGIEAAVKQFIGMFAFVLWDRTERVLHLVRDRMGEKPLYYGRMGGSILFGSELKALRAHPAFKGEIDRDALALYLRHNCIPAPYSIYRGIYKLPPGTMLAVSGREASFPAPVQYWSAREAAERGMAEPFTGSTEEAIAALDGLLRDAVRFQMVADVPLGAFLSGGVDSSTVVALMQAQSDRPVKTFTIGFKEADYNEALHAKAVAACLGTEHTELYVTPAEAMAVIPKLPDLYDEPFADSSQIPTFLVSELARRSVTVSLSGDGGDELFAGYNRYFWGRSIWKKLGWMPRSLRAAAAAVLTAVPPQSWDRVFGVAGPLLPSAIKQRNPGDKIHKLAEILAAESPEAMYRGLASHWKDPASVVLGAREPPTALTDRRLWSNLPDFTQRMMYLDTVTYLPDDILVKVDRASMGVSLEARIPFLDHRVVEFAWRLPLSMKVRDGEGKWLLRQVLYRYVPKELIERPKTGFGLPIDAWLRGPLRDWAEDLLDKKRLSEEGFFDPLPVREKWKEHLSGTRNWQHYLWDVLMFQAWVDQH
jgi:asparagine synthase (glutamine-hydrolysing)